MNRIVMDLQYFTEDGAAAAAAPAEVTGGGSEAAVSASGPIRVGDTLPDGQQVQSSRVAAEMERQMKRHPELRKVYGQPGAQQAQAQKAPEVQPGQPAVEQPHEKTIQERFEEAKKGEFKDLIGQEIQRAIKDRFKNQADAKQQLDSVQPMLQALMKKAGVDTVEELSALVLDDDSLYEEEAEAAGMTVKAYKEFKALQEEHDRRNAEDQANIEQQYWRDHFTKLAQQAEELKKIIPGLNLQEEMKNETFQRLTHPSVGLSVEDAYFTIHRKELEPQMMAYGMNRAKQQMGQTIQAQKKRPAEGAMRGTAQQAADVQLDFSKLDRKERDEYRRKVHAGLIGGRFA